MKDGWITFRQHFVLKQQHSQAYHLLLFANPLLCLHNGDYINGKNYFILSKKRVGCRPADKVSKDDNKQLIYAQIIDTKCVIISHSKVNVFLH